MKKSIFVLLILAVCLCSCSGVRNGNGGRVQFSTGQDGSGKYCVYLNIMECGDFNIVTIENPWDTTKILNRYILVDRNSEIPEDIPDGIVVRIPVEKAIIYSSVHCSIVEQLGAIEAIAGVCEPEYINSDAVKSRIIEGKIADLGNSADPDVEKILDMEADVIIASPFENSSYGVVEKTGIPIVAAADYMENHPLGKTEWVKFYGLLFGRKLAADSLFAAVDSSYQSLKELVSKSADRPSVLLESMYGGVWDVPCGGSYIGMLHNDAGADYVFGTFDGPGSRTLLFESVFDAAEDADIWLLKNDYTLTYSGLRSQYEPYSNFRAFKEKRIYACNTVKTTYYEDITLRPDLILKDFIYIYHPEFLDGYTPAYYFPLDE